MSCEVSFCWILFVMMCVILIIFRRFGIWVCIWMWVVVMICSIRVGRIVLFVLCLMRCMILCWLVGCCLIC